MSLNVEEGLPSLGKKNNSADKEKHQPTITTLEGKDNIRQTSKMVSLEKKKEASSKSNKAESIGVDDQDNTSDEEPLSKINQPSSKICSKLKRTADKEKHQPTITTFEEKDHIRRASKIVSLEKKKEASSKSPNKKESIGVDDQDDTSDEEPQKMSFKNEVKYQELTKASPRVVLIDFKKTENGLLLNEKVVKNDKNNLALKNETCLLHQTDDHVTVDSGEYFSQLELTPSSTSFTPHKNPLKSLQRSPSKKKLELENGSSSCETIVIDDDNPSNSPARSTAASLSAHDLEGPKQCSVSSLVKHGSTKSFPSSVALRNSNVSVPLTSSLSERKSVIEKGLQVDKIFVTDIEDNFDKPFSIPKKTYEKSNKSSPSPSQKSVSINNIITRNIQKDHDLIKTDCNLVTKKQCFPFNRSTRSFSLSAHVQPSRIFQPQSITETHNFNSPKWQSNNNITNKQKDDLQTKDLLQNKQSKTVPSKVIRHTSLNSIVNVPMPQNTAMKNDVSPLMPVEIQAQVDHSLELLPNASAPTPVILQQTLPQVDQTLIPIDCKTLKPLPTLNVGVVLSPSFVPPSIASAQFDIFSTKHSSSINDNKIKESFCSSTVSSTQAVRKYSNSSTKRKLASSNEAGVQNELQQFAVHCSSSPLCDMESDVTLQKRKKYEAPPVTKFMLSDQGINKNQVPITKRNQAVSNGAKSKNELHHMHCASSTHSASDLVTVPKRRKLEAPPTFILLGFIKTPDPLAKAIILDNKFLRQEGASVSSTHLSNECVVSTSLEKRKYQETKTNTLPKQTSEIMSEVSSSNCYEPDPVDGNINGFALNKILSKNVTLNTMVQNDNKESMCQTNVENQVKEKKENLYTFHNTKNNMKGKFDGKFNKGASIQSDFTEQKRNLINNKADRIENKNKQIESKEKHISFEEDSNGVIKEIMPVSLSANLNKQSDSSIKWKSQEYSKKNVTPSKVFKRIKSREEELEDCLDGVPPFIQEVFKCENIRDGFDNKDLIFVLSLLPDIEEMTSTQKVMFQSRAIKIIDDVFTNPIVKGNNRR